MLGKQIDKNTLFYGDNLPILREYIPDESIDLIYLDPPFNSNRTYNVLFKDEGGQDSEAKITAFEDTWHWDRAAEETYHEIIKDSPPRVASMIGALREFIGTNQMMAYLVMMTIRLAELHRVLKPTGSLYLHCDPTASHYLKFLLDTIFGAENFRNEICWKRTSAHSSAKRWGPIHDIIFFYSKSNSFCWNKVYQKYEQDYIDTFYRHIDGDRRYQLVDLTAPGIRKGDSRKSWHDIDPTTKKRHWAVPTALLKQFLSGKKIDALTTQEKLDFLDKKGLIYWPKKGEIPRFKRYLSDSEGIFIQDVVIDIKPISSQAKERLGYPTQKPLALLERIIEASSNEGDVVLDPFCGCGTAVAAAEKFNRKWLSIDITHLSVALQKYRLQDMFNLIAGKDYKVIGEPESLASAKELAHQNRYQFQWWALSLVRAKPLGGEAGSKKGKKGKDKGIDGVINFEDIEDGKTKLKRLLVQVKSGKVKSGDIRDLVGTIERENAPIGVFISLEKPTKDMNTEAVSAGFYKSEAWGKKYPKIQILTIEQLLTGEEIKMPEYIPNFKQAKPEPTKTPETNLFNNY